MAIPDAREFISNKKTRVFAFSFLLLLRLVAAARRARRGGLILILDRALRVVPCLQHGLPLSLFLLSR